MAVQDYDPHRAKQFPQNPGYGNGCYRRRIRLKQTDWGVLAELEDDCHGFRIRLYHDGSAVTAVEADTLRIPYNTCSGAVEPLKQLCGLPVGSEPKAIIAQVSPFANCTHLFDLAVLAISHAGRDTAERQYDVQVDDEKDGQPAEAAVWRDGREILRYTTQTWQILGPADVAGKPFFKGFAAWAGEHYQGDEREAAFVLQKGYFVSSARRHDAKAMVGARGDDHPYIPGACHTYSDENVTRAFRLPDTIRDFTDRPADLLHFK